MPTDFIDIQKDFQKRADARRFKNRVDNPFIKIKEEKFAELVAGKMPAGGGKIVEIGCGEGNNLIFIRRRLPNASLYGVDFSIGKLLFMAGVADEMYSVCADALALPFADASFDLVLLRDILHHVNWARAELLAEAKRILKPGGVILVFESDGRTPLNRLFMALYPAERGMIDSTREKLSELCGRFGSVEIEGFEAGQLVRAAGFFLGVPGGPSGFLKRIIYGILIFFESFSERSVSRDRWFRMMFTIRPDK